jgi:hypothetical protein
MTICRVVLGAVAALMLAGDASAQMDDIQFQTQASSFGERYSVRSQGGTVAGGGMTSTVGEFGQRVGGALLGASGLPATNNFSRNSTLDSSRGSVIPRIE